jgi:hypothetical protein
MYCGLVIEAIVIAKPPRVAPTLSFVGDRELRDWQPDFDRFKNPAASRPRITTLRGTQAVEMV